MVFQQIIGRLTGLSSRRGNLRSTRKQKRRLMQLERMERRELLANDLAAISGFTFDDLDGNGTQDVGEPIIPFVTVSLFRETNINGQFDDPTSGTPDLLEGTIQSDALGFFRFPGLDGPDNDNPGGADGSKNPDGVGRYWLVEDVDNNDPDVAGRIKPGPIGVDITDDTGVVQTVIDDYAAVDGDGQSVSGLNGVFSESSLIATGVLGGERDIQLNIVSNSETNPALGTVTLGVSTAQSRLTLSTPSSAVAQALVQYDGLDGAIGLQPTGLGNANLDGGDNQGGLELAILSDLPLTDGLRVTVYTDAANFSVADISLPGGSIDTTIFVPFSDFVQGGAGPADFSDVGAIEAFVDPTIVNPDLAGVDFQISVLESRVSNEITVNLANVIPLSLGGTLFFDNSSGGQNNGLRESNEAAIVGATVVLYELANATDTVNLENDIPLTSQTTTGNQSTLGFNYSFDNLTPGHYAVVIPTNQFSGGAILSGFANSTGNDPPADPDNDVDNDDNGLVLSSTDNLIDGSVFSQTITLASGTEPTTDDINAPDPNSNTTLDFGFFPQIDLGITKTLDTVNSDLSPGGQAIFSFVVQNNGPRDATGVTVTDIFPAGLTPTGIQNASGAFTLTPAGNTITVNIGDIANTAAVTFDLTADIGANQFTDLTNPASVQGNEVDINPANDNDTADVDLPEADLQIAKTDLQDPANAGGPLTYQITVFNDGPDDAAGVVVTDVLPATVTFVSGNVDGNQSLVNVDGATGNIIATVGPLADQATATITILVTVDPDSPTPILNTATVTSTPNTDPDLLNNSTTEPTDIDRVVDIEVVKTVAGSTVAGEDATYTVVVTNNGPGDARGIEVTDTLDADLTLVAGSFDPGATGVTILQVGQDLSFDVGDLLVDQSVSFTFDVTIDSDATGTIPNTADVTTTDDDSVPINNTDAADIVVTQEIDLILTKTVNLLTAVPGQDQLVYTFLVAHHPTNSPSDATGVTVSDVLPAGVSGVVIDAPTADNTGFAGGTVTVEFDSLPVGETRTFTVTVDVNEDATGTITNPASVAANETDRDTSNNDDDADTNLNPDFDVFVTKTVSDATPAPLQTITYTVELENEGPSTAFGVVLSDPIPVGLTFVSGAIGGLTGTSDGTTVTFPGVDLDSGETVSASLTFTVDASAAGTITNTASVPDMSNAGENDTTNNSDSIDLTVQEIVDVRIEKSVNTPASRVGDTLTYTVMVTNDGPSLAQDVQVTDTLPVGLTFVDGTGPNNEALAIVNGVVTVIGGDLANTGTFSFTINALVDNGAGSTVVNTANVTTTTNETVLGNNTANVSTNIDPMTASIAGSVYIDLDNDGLRDPNEEGIPDVMVTLVGTDSLGNSVNLTETTNANGDYLFANLGAGTYTVQETQPAGFIDGIDTRGTGAGATAGDDVFTQLGLGEAATAQGFDFGERISIDPFSKRRFLASS